MPDLSVIIPTLGNHSSLAMVLEAFEREIAEAGCAVELIVAVDHGDPDPAGVGVLAAGRPYPVRVVSPSQGGASANRNAGVAASEAPLILFCDNDTVPGPGMLAEHLSWHAEHPGWEVGVLGVVRWASDRRVTPFMRWLDHGIQFDFPNIEGVDAGWGRFYSANASIKRELFDRVGGFDAERLPYLYEDLDFGYRASKLGFRLLYNPDAEVEHESEMDLEFWLRKLPRLARAERAFVNKHPEIAPYFRNLFADALAKHPARGRGRALIGRIGPRTPLIGPYLWTSADIYYRQRLAPTYLEAWEEAGLSPEPGTGSQPSGSEPSGPK